MKYNFKSLPTFILVTIFCLLVIACGGTTTPEPDGIVSISGDFWADTICTESTVGFTFNEASSVNSNSEGLIYRYDFGDNTGIIETTNTQVTHNYTSAGTYEATLTVSTDGVNAASENFTKQIIVKNDSSCNTD